MAEARNTAKITATVNGYTIASPDRGHAGGVNDANSNVYGSSVAGVWVLSLPISLSYLAHDWFGRFRECCRQRQDARARLSF